MKQPGTRQRKPKSGFVDSKNPALASWRKWKNIEKARKAAEDERYNSLCGPVTITYINK
jgi:hypothetical protein